jgi:predicted MPP superfamily phosphohydrolase
MSLTELISASVFVTAVAMVYVLAVEVAFRAWKRRKQRDDEPLSAWRLWYPRIVLTLAAIGLVCMAYARLIEPNWLQVTHVEIQSLKIRSGTFPIRIVQISDTHSEAKPRLEPRLPGVIAGLNPDLIFFTGDAANGPAGVPVFRKLMKDLSAIAPTYAVAGNWDMRHSWSDLLYGGLGITELDGKAQKVTIRGVDIWIAGAPFDQPELVNPMLAAVPRGALTVLLFHSPDLVQSLPPGKVDLYFAGHTHGGQVALPFYGALITFSKFGKQYESGLSRYGDTLIYVNRGIGMEGGPVPRVRFCSRPEVTAIDLAPVQ